MYKLKQKMVRVSWPGQLLKFVLFFCKKKKQQPVIKKKTIFFKTVLKKKQSLKKETFFLKKNHGAHKLTRTPGNEKKYIGGNKK